MTSHELAKLLLSGPDMPVAIWTNQHGIAQLTPITDTHQQHVGHAVKTVIRLISDSDEAFDYA